MINAWKLQDTSDFMEGSVSNSILFNKLSKLKKKCNITVAKDDLKDVGEQNLG